MSLKVASWNINSIKVRKDQVLRFLKDSAPDVLMIQELKGSSFPVEAFRGAGYESVCAAQKTYNGVAILSKTPIKVIRNKLPGDNTDKQARYLEAEIQGVRLINIYLPNGNPAPGEKYNYKLAWMERLYAQLSALRKTYTSFAVGGDFNVIPEGRDCYDPDAWKEDALYRIETRKAFRKLKNLGLTDAFRVFNTGTGQYTFWDYQRGDWQNGRGIRIDHFLLSPEITDRLQRCTIDKKPRGWTQPSDHAPIIMEIAA